jgi:hypothetical protein
MEIASLFRSLIKITFDPKADIERGILMVCKRADYESPPRKSYRGIGSISEGRELDWSRYGGNTAKG